MFQLLRTSGTRGQLVCHASILLNPTRGLSSVSPPPQKPPVPLSIVTITSENIQSEVLSSPIPVILDCHAEWCGPCKQLAPLLERAVKSTGGKVRLATLDVDVEKALAAKLSVQSLPTVFGVHSGRLVDSFIGMRTDAEVQAFVDKLLKASEDMGPPSSAEGGATEEEEEPPKSPMEQAADALASGDVEAATALYKQVYSALRATTSSANPEANTQSRQDKDKGLLQQATCLVGLASCAQMSGDTDAVVELLSLVKKEHAFEVGNDAGLARAVAQLELATKGKASSSAEEGGSGSLADLEAKLSAALELEEGASSAEGVLALRLDLAHALFAQSRYDEALDQALLIVKADVQWREGAGKALCLQFFDALGNDHPAVKKGRRRLGNLLFV